VRESSFVTGVEVELLDGSRQIINVNTGGKVVLAGGALSTPRILINSGIGPADQIKTVQGGSVGVTLPEESEWIDLPVGKGLKDHPIVTLKFKTKSSLSSLDTTAFTKPDQTNIDSFAQGNGLLVQGGQRLNFWSSVKGTDGIERFIQGTCNSPSNDTIKMKVYLTHGLTSTGEIGITADGKTEYITQPWLNTDEDKEALASFVDRLISFAQAENSTLTLDAGLTASSNVTGADLIKTFVTGSHYVGTAKMGEDDGRKGGAAVVDLDTKVYGTDNLFVVDASFHPDLPTGNTQAIVMVAAEAAAKKVAAVKVGSAPAASSSAAASSATATQAVSSTAVASSTAVSSSAAAVTSAPESASITSAPTSTSETATFTGTTAITSVAVPSPAYTEVPKWGRCGGIGYDGPTKCASGSTCKYQNDWYYQCLRKPCQNCVGRNVAAKCIYEQPLPQAIVLQSKSRSPASAEDKFPPLETPDGTALSSFYDVHAFTDLKKLLETDEVFQVSEFVQETSNQSKPSSKFWVLAAQLPDSRVMTKAFNYYFDEVHWRYNVGQKYYMNKQLDDWKVVVQSPASQQIGIDKNLPYFVAFSFQLLAVILQYMRPDGEIARLLGATNSRLAAHMSRRYNDAASELMLMLGRHNGTITVVDYDLLRASWLKNNGRGIESWYAISDGVR
ncbi:FAD/NAD(P)-binding domain-containing protein, partial [Aureobasidium melanogenum]